MLSKKGTIFFLLAISLFVLSASFGANSETVQMEDQEYKQDLNRIDSLRKSFNPGPTNDIKSFEKFADELQKKWKAKDPELYAKLMLDICRPITSGRFNTDERFNIARKYALLALSDPNKITLETELELTGHVKTPMFGPEAPKEMELADQRKKDVEVRFHAWKRLIDAIDPNWDPDDLPTLNIAPPHGVIGGRAGMASKDIKDPNLRAEYEAAIEKNRQKAERYLEQSRLRDWLKRFPKRAEEYIIRAYSKPPFNVEELKQSFARYEVDEKTRARILDAVTKNMQEQAEKIPK